MPDDSSTILVPIGTRRVTGQFALIDAEDADVVLPYPWSLSHGYACRIRRPTDPQGGSHVYMHRVIAGTPVGMETDHINRDRLDNRRANLRIVTRVQNSANIGVRSHNSSGFIGVCYDKKRCMWMAYAKKYVGHFETPEEAALARDKAAFEMWGEFAQLNFPTR